MKKNNKGFFLAETIVVIALVTTVMAFVYPNITKLYENYKNRANYYDQTEDLYALKAVYEGNKYAIDTLTQGTYTGCSEEELGGKYISNLIGITVTNKPGILKELYISSYMSNLSSDNYNFNKYLKRLKKTNYDSAAYSLIGVFEEVTEIRYASIKVDNPNPNRNCKLGGQL